MLTFVTVDAETTATAWVKPFYGEGNSKRFLYPALRLAGVTDAVPDKNINADCAQISKGTFMSIYIGTLTYNLYV